MTQQSILALFGGGLVAGGVITFLWWMARHRKLNHVSEVRWMRRVRDAEAARDEHHVRMDKALDEARAREARVTRALAENEETLALLSDEKVPAFEVELTRRNERIAELERKAAAYRASLADAADELTITNASLDKTRSALRERDARLDELAELETGFQQMRAHADRQQQLVTAMQTEREDRDRELALIQRQADEAKSAQTELQRQLQASSERARIQRHEGDARLGELQTRFESVSLQSQEAQARLTSVMAEAQELAALRDASQAELMSLREQVPDIESELSTRNEQLAAQQAEIDALTKHLGELQSNLAHREQRLTALTQEVGQHEQAIAAAREETLALRDANSRSQAHLEDKQATIDELRGRLSEYEHKLPDYENELRKRDERIAAIRSEFTALRDRLPALNDALREREASIEDLAKELSRQRKRYIELQANLLDSGKVQATQQPAQVIRLREHREQRADQARPPSGIAPSLARPTGLTGEPPGKPDDLKKVRGIGPVLERRLNELGLYRFDQIAALSASDIDWLTVQLRTFAGRIERDDWVGQAHKLAHSRDEGSKRSGC